MDVELPTLQAIKRFVCMGNGVALVPKISVENEITRGDLVRVPVRDLHFQRKLRLGVPQDPVCRRARTSVLSSAEQVAKDRGGRYRFQREKIAPMSVWR